jgi:hypothetical protein
MEQEKLPLSPLHKKDIVSVAKGILARQIGIVEGCRKLVALSEYMDERDEYPWLGIRGVESETDDLPLGEQRSLWNKEALEQIETSVAAYVKKEEAGIFDDCRKLIELYDQDS